MTTVIDPSGSPVPVFNRSGTTIVSLVAGHAASSPTPAVIPVASGHTIVLVSLTENEENAVELPTSSDVGDSVEICLTSSSILYVYPHSGDTINNSGSRYSMGTAATVFRKATSTSWYRTGG